MTRPQAAAVAGSAGPVRSAGPAGPGIRGREGVAGWLFVAPVVVILGLFLLAPILLALWVSLSDWSGNGSPLAGGVHFVGGRNYTALLTHDGLARDDFMVSLRNNFYYVLLVVPLQTALALGLALALHRRRLAGQGFFRTAYYFPSVTSSVAISVVFLFLFSSSGTINAVLGLVGINGPSWFADPRGILQLLASGLGLVDPAHPPAALVGHQVLGLSVWDWLSGPSVAMCSIIFLVVWTSAGGYMLIFLAALQNLPLSVTEAAVVDGATASQRLRRITLPMIRPTVFLVLTIGLIGTWQVFDQIYVMSQGNPGKTTLTPAYLSYTTSFTSQQWGQGTAIAFILFTVIVVFTVLQRWALRERGERRRWAFRRASR
ncbi:MAG TPA: sugar ABC transporter permease [Mycobacteriales bacterium]|nr:sugar ABC transporter permease [Mycobacteriales bacterium]